MLSTAARQPIMYDDDGEAIGAVFLHPYLQAVDPLDEVGDIEIQSVDVVVAPAGPAQLELIGPETRSKPGAEATPAKVTASKTFQPDLFVELETELLPATEVVLRPYQIAANNAICAPPVNVHRQLVVIATGGGKTIVAADLVKRLVTHGKRALFLAHREELISQAIEKIRWYYPEANVEREKAESRAFRGRRGPADAPNVVVASIQSLHPKRLAEFDPDAFDLIIVDETHHATAQTYRNIFDYFGAFDERCTPLVGITATPDRGDRKSLKEIFQREAYRRDICQLIRDEYLCDVRAKRVTSQTDLTGVGTVRGDFDPALLADAVDTAERNALIIQAYLKYGQGRKAVLFGASVPHAQRLAELFEENGIRSEAIWGDLDTEERKARLKRFKDGVTQVLTNFNVLIEGYDEPSIACVIIGRPTKSASILTQMVGRGTRLHPDKGYLLVIDIKDEGKAMSVAAAFGLPNEFKVDENVSLAEASEMVSALDPGLRDKALDMESLRKVHERVRAGLDAEEIDILERREAEAAVRDISKLRFQKSGDGYVLPISTKTRLPNGKTETSVERYTLEMNDLEQWEMRWSKGEKSRVSPEVFNSEKAAFEHWDAFIEKRHVEEAKLLSNDAPWLNEPASDKQLFTLFGYGKFKSLIDIPPELTKAEAGDLLTRCMEAEGKGGPKFSYKRVPEHLRHVRPPIAWSGPKRRKKAA